MADKDKTQPVPSPVARPVRQRTLLDQAKALPDRFKQGGVLGAGGVLQGAAIDRALNSYSAAQNTRNTVAPPVRRALFGQSAVSPTAQASAAPVQNPGIDFSKPAPGPAGGEGMAAANTLPNAPKTPAAPPVAAAPAAAAGADNTFRTFSGGTGQLPAGVSVQYGPNGTPIFSDSPAGARTLTGSPQQQIARASAAADMAMGPTRALTSVAAPPSTQGVVQSATQRALSGQRDATRTARADAAEMLNPMSTGAEVMRRLENSQRSYMNRGSPSARAAQAQAYMGQLAAMNAATAAGQGAANSTLQAGVAGEGQAADAAAARQLTARQLDISAAQQAEQARQFDQTGQVLTDREGAVSLLRNDGSLTPLQTESGQPFRMLASTQQGQVTPALQYQELSRQLQTLREAAAMNPSSGAAQQIAAIEAQMVALAGGGQVQQATPPAAAIERLRSNPGAAAQFDEIFGAGAAARYLNR